MKLKLTVQFLYSPPPNLSEERAAGLSRILSDNLVGMLDLAIAEGAITGPPPDVELVSVRGAITHIPTIGDEELLHAIERNLTEF